MSLALLSASAAAALTALPFIAEARRIPMTPAMQAQAPGEILELPMGRTHFQSTGPEDGPLAVCIHGLTTPSYVYAGTRQSLETLGFRVLTYDLFGRGYSDRPGGKQTADFFVRQLESLLSALAEEGPLTVIGFSMGGAIATRFVSENLDKTGALVLIAPAGLQPVYADGTHRLKTAPVIGDWYARIFGGRDLRRELLSEDTPATVTPDLLDRQIAETRFQGFLPSVLSSKRHCLRENFNADHQRIADAGVPTLGLWGEDDTVIPISTLGRLAELNPNAHHVQVAGAGHSLPQTHPAQVGQALANFLVPLRPRREAP